jgi:hypothetical protein
MEGSGIALVINPHRKAQVEGYCNRLAIFVHPSIYPGTIF